MSCKSWKTYKLGDLGSFFGGVTSIKPSDYGFGTPFLTYKNIFKNSKVDINELELMNVRPQDVEKRAAIYGDIFFTASSETPDEVAMSSVLLDSVPNLTYNGFCKRYRLNDFEILLPEFARYLFRSRLFREAVCQVATGDIRFNISQESLSNIKVHLPSITEQKRISRVLFALDDKIELNHRINDNLEQQAQAIFKSWFVDFELFKGGEFVESKLGKIPAEWSILPIEDIAERVAMGPFGSNIKVETFVDSGIPIISGNHLRGLFLDELGYNFITEEHARRLSNSIVHAGDIIFTHAGNIGQVALIPENCDYSYYIISQRQFYLRCDKQKALPEYINYFFHSRKGQGYLLANASQTGVPSIARPSSHLKSIVLPIPPIQVQQDWLNIVKPMLQMLNKNSKEIKKMSSLRDTLLPKLMSGELSVEDAERQL